MEEVLLFATIISPIILGLIEVLKRSATISNNYVPLLAVVVGVVIGFAATPFTDLDTVSRLWAGGIAGLSATGLFELFSHRNGTTTNSTEK